TVGVVLLFTRLGSLQMAGSGMSPTLEMGERILYEKRVESALLRHGTVIVYRLSDRSAWSGPGSLTISRILAVPGDQLSVSGRMEPGAIEAVLRELQPSRWGWRFNALPGAHFLGKPVGLRVDTQPIPTGDPSPSLDASETELVRLVLGGLPGVLAEVERQYRT